MSIAEVEVAPLPPASSPVAAPDVLPTRLEMPEAAQPVRYDWGYVSNIAIIHALSLFAFVPWLFSWTGLVLCVAGLPFYGILGITLGYHRLLTHQGLIVPKWLERCFALLGVCCLQDTPARWVAIHRLHHRHSDRQPDPHSPLVSFLWSHMGWVMVQNREHSRISFFEKYARDILKDPLYFALERNLAWFWVYWLHAMIYPVVGLLVGRAITGTWWGGVQFGLSLLVWGVFVRTVAIWHITWSVNSVTHVMGYRNYETNDDSRNHWLIALLAHGEGWHNNHHADQRAAAHGHKWWEYDLTFAVVRLLEAVGLAKNVVRPRVWRKKEAKIPAAAALTGSAPEPAPRSVDHRS